jgi:hypothetical protein
MGTQRQRIRANLTVFWWLYGFISTKENKHKNQGVFYDLFLWGKAAKNQGYHLTYATSDYLAVFPNSFEFPLPMHVPGVRGIHCSCHLRGKGWHQFRRPHATTIANSDMSKKLLPYSSFWPSAFTLFLSLPGLYHHNGVTYSPCLIEGRAVTSHVCVWGGGTFGFYFLLLLFPPWRNADSLSFFYLPSIIAPTNYRDLGPRSLSQPFVPLLQISANTGRERGFSPVREGYRSLKSNRD